jgi:hypothetical protein
MHFLIPFLFVFGLFSTGPGGRHDWMRFHANDVGCPNVECSGLLRWQGGSNRTELYCDHCEATFTVTLVKPKSIGRKKSN